MTVRPKSVRDFAKLMALYCVREGIPFQTAKEELEQQFVKQLTPILFGNQSRIAKRMGIHRNTLARKLQKNRERLAARGPAPTILPARWMEQEVVGL